MKIITDMALNLQNEMPIVCLLYKQGRVFVTNNIYTQHAEMLMLTRHDCRDGWIFINIEPCPMCLFALSLAKVKRVFFGAYNSQYGACGGAFHLRGHVALKIVDYDGGFWEQENAAILRRYFENRRIKFENQ